MIAQVPSPNHSSRGSSDVVATVIHYTAGGSARGAIRWFQMPESKASSHYVIARDGFVTQMVDLSRRAWHAGRARLQHKGGATTRVNHCTIGIELANCGLLVEQGGGFFWEQGRRLIPYRGPDPIGATLEYAAGKLVVRVNGHWEPYPAEQLAALEDLIQAIARAGYPGAALNLVGHEEIAGPDIRPERFKLDPGPLFPWGRFRRSMPVRTSSVIHSATGDDGRSPTRES